MQKYSVIFENEAITRIKSFIEYLRIRSRERFYDSGIHGLDEIVTNYDKSHRELQDSIFDEFERLGKLSIIGTIYNEEGNKRKTRLIFPIRSYTIVAWCTADTKDNTLTVESISINT